MLTPVPLEYRHGSRNPRNFGALYIAVVLLSLHWVIVLFINSSYLAQFVNAAAIGLFYTTSSALTILSFLFISRVLNRTGNYKLILWLSILEFCVLIGMAASDSLRVSIPLFMLHQAIVPLILFNLDIFMEEMIGNEEKTTGGRRGLYLAIMSFAGAVSPLIAGFLLGSAEPRFAFVYIASAIVMIAFMFVIIRYFKTFADPKYNEIKVLPTLHSFWVVRDVRNVFFAHFLLQLFFAWMVIYTPLYLATVIGFNWQEIGLVLFAGFSAYVFFEYPIGIVADRWLGEKEMMLIGFIIIALATSWFVLLSGAHLGAWMLAMFMTRVGASFVEVTSESYFFKHIDGSSPNIISFFRVTRPLSYVIGALLGSLALLYVPFEMLFLILALLMIPGILFALALKDTR